MTIFTLSFTHTNRSMVLCIMWRPMLVIQGHYCIQIQKQLTGKFLCHWLRCMTPN